MLQLELDEKLEAKFERNLKDSLDLVETVFLRGPGKFLENGEEVSLADIVLVCQLKQLLVRCLGMDIARQSILVFFCVFLKNLYIYINALWMCVMGSFWIPRHKKICWGPGKKSRPGWLRWRIPLTLISRKRMNQHMLLQGSFKLAEIWLRSLVLELLIGSTESQISKIPLPCQMLEELRIM